MLRLRGRTKRSASRSGLLCAFFFALSVLLGAGEKTGNCATPANAYIQGINSAALLILENLFDSGILKGQTLAVGEFTDESSGKRCAALATTLENQLERALNLGRLSLFPGQKEEDTFKIVRGGRDKEMSYLLSTDILVNGQWQCPAKGVVDLTVKAIEFGEFGDYEICTAARRVSFQGLMPGAKKCLKPEKTLSSSVRSLVLQNKLRELDLRIESLFAIKEVDDKKIRLTALLNKRNKVLNALKVKSAQGALAYSSRKIGQNKGWLNFKSFPAGQSIYINGMFIGQSPVFEYPVQAGAVLRIKACGDLRYFDPVKKMQRFGQFSRLKIDLDSDRGEGEVLLVGKNIIDTVLVDEKPYDDFNSARPVLTLIAGHRHIRLWQGIRSADYKMDIWRNDVLELNYKNLLGSGESGNRDELAFRKKLIEERKTNRILETRVRAKIEETARLSRYAPQTIASIPPRLGTVHALAVQKSGEAAALGLDAGMAIVDLKTGTPQLKSSLGRTTALAYAPDGKMIASGHGNVVAVWELPALKLKMRIKVQGGGKFVAGLCFSPDSKIIAAGSDRGVINFLSLDSGKQIGDLKLYSYPEITSSMVFLDDKRLASRLVTGPVQIWDWRSGSKIGQFANNMQVFDPAVFNPAFNRGLSRMLSSSADNGFGLWSVGTKKKLRTFNGLSNLKGVAFFPFDWSVAGWNSSRLIFGDMETGAKVAAIEGLNSSLVQVADGNKSVVCVQRGLVGNELVVWKMKKN